jgi:3-dehydroquinate dehydratase-2
MSNDDIAAAVLECVGGFPNVTDNSLCATRLRISLRDIAEVNHNALKSIGGVLGVVGRGTNGIEVVFGPNLVRGVYQSFKELTGILDDAKGQEDVVSEPVRPAGNFQVNITPETPGRPQVTSVPVRKPIEKPVIDEGTNALLEKLDEDDDVLGALSQLDD